MSFQKKINFFNRLLDSAVGGWWWENHIEQIWFSQQGNHWPLVSSPWFYFHYRRQSVTHLFLGNHYEIRHPVQCSKEPISWIANITPVSFEAASSSDCHPSWAYDITTSKIRLSSPARTIWPWAWIANSPTCPSFTSPGCPCCPLAPQWPLPWLLYACWIWWQLHILCDSFHLQQKVFISGDLDVLSIDFQYTIFNTNGDAWQWRTN